MCSANAGCFDAPSAPGRPPVHATGLEAGASRPDELLTVGSVSVAGVTAGRDARIGPAVMKKLHEDLYEAVRRELNVDVFRAGPSGRGDASAELRTEVTAYQERVGTRAAASVPASVAFRMSLLRRSDGREVWGADYYFKDQAATDNLFAIGGAREGSGKIGWKTAAEIAGGAFRAAARDLADRRTAAFSSSPAPGAPGAGFPRNDSSEKGAAGPGASWPGVGAR